MGLDQLTKKLCNRRKFRPTKIHKNTQAAPLRSDKDKRAVLRWTERALKNYRTKYVDEECTIVFNYEGSAGITFIMPRTFEKVPFSDYCEQWASFLATKPPAAQIEAIMYSLFEMFCEKHTCWNRTWYGIKADIVHASKDNMDLPSLEVDGRGIVWCFRWSVENGP
jgi:hypothetical protein